MHRGARASTGSPSLPCPEELFLYILSFLDYQDLARVALVCKEWRRLAQDQLVWKNLFFRRWKYSPKLHRTDWQASFRIAMQCDVRLRNLTSHSLREYRVSGHTDGVSCLLLDDDIILSGGQDFRIFLWRSADGAFLRTFKDHTAEIRSFVRMENRFASSSADSTIKLWSLSGGLLWTFSGHTADVPSIQVTEDALHLFSASLDGTLRQWDIESGKCVRVWKDHTAGVHKVAIDNKRVYTASWDHTIKVWDPAVGHALRTLEFPSAIDCMQVQDGVLIGGSQRLISAWDMKTDLEISSVHASAAVSCMHFFDSNYLMSGFSNGGIRLFKLYGSREMQPLLHYSGHRKRITALQTDGRKVVSASQDTQMRVFDFASGRCLVVFAGHSDWVSCMQFDEKCIVTGSHDHEIKLYSFL